MGIKVEDEEHITAGLDEALASPRPCLLEFVTDPEVPPLPPHINFEQAVNYWKAILKGDQHGTEGDGKHSGEVAVEFPPDYRQGIRHVVDSQDGLGKRKASKPKGASKPGSAGGR